MVHIFHCVFIFFVGFLSHFYQIVDLITVLLVSFVDGVHALEDFFGDFGLFLNGLKLGNHFLDCLYGLIVIFEFILIKFLICVGRRFVVHGFL